MAFHLPHLCAPSRMRGQFPDVPARRSVPRRRYAWGLLLVLLGGCVGSSAGESSPPVAVWGRRGISDGRFQKPRAMVIDRQDQIYIIDMTARIQVFDLEGNYLRGWQTPTHANGRPTGISIDRDGNILIADTHYFQVLCYSPEGTLLYKLGGTHGTQPGEFGFVTDVAQDSLGNYYISEYGEFDRIHKFSQDRQLIREWGGHGTEPGRFMRPQSIAVDNANQVWVADACNHRVQIFSADGELLRTWGGQGSEPGQLYYPYGLTLDGQGHVYVCEFGNHRVQKFTLDGESLGCWGRSGAQPGELAHPWAVGVSSTGRVFVLDSNNHRVQEIRL